MIYKTLKRYPIQLIIIGVFLLAGGVGFWYMQKKDFEQIKIIKKLFCTNDNQFLRSVGSQVMLSSGHDVDINPSGTAHYFYDNFDSYGDVFSRVVDQFESMEGFSVSGEASGWGLAREGINGPFALSMETVSSPSLNNDPSNNIIIRKTLSQPIDLSLWNNNGFFSAWLNIEDRKGISSVALRIGDIDGNVREFQELPNLQVNIPNNFDSDDLFPNIVYPTKEAVTDEWTDFWLNKGWNYLFWRADEEGYSGSKQFDSSKISWFQITLEVNDSLPAQKIMIDDLRFQVGLQKHSNSLGGVWYPPLGRPQYGIFDIDRISANDYALKLLNVRQNQYPSNGDHGRMLLQYKTPLNFAMRVRFSLENLPRDAKERVNTWFRLMYDFDPEYDPGHDWFGTYISMEWDRFGLITVKPLERFSIQEQEPKNEDISIASKRFTPKEGVIYEEQVTVHGQDAEASLYEVVDDCLILKERIKYTFKRLRYGDDKRYPVGIEITGNAKAIIREFEMKEL